MIAKFLRRYLFIGISISFFCCSFPFRALIALENPDDFGLFLRNQTKEQLLVVCVGMRNLETRPMQEYGLGLIADLIRIYDSKPPQWPDSLRKRGYSTYEIADTLIRATKFFAGYEEAKAGKAFVYGLVDSADEPGQDLAMLAIVDFDG